MTAPLHPGSWTIDPAHTLVAFSVRHMTIARVTGRFTVVAGEVSVPAEDPYAATVTATVAVRTVSSGHSVRDERIRSADFLDADRYPVMEFTSYPAAAAASNDRWRLPGDLTIKDTTRPVVFDTEFGGVVAHRGADRAGFSATTQISRKDFGVTWSGLLDSGGLIVSDTVHIELEVELVRNP